MARRNERGFTLIELMIVVAIISILAALAIPNYLSFQCRSKQAESKSGLGALFTSEKSFIAEHNSYGTDLVYVGWEPEGSPLYLYGFNGVSFPSALNGDSQYSGSRNNTGDAAVIGSPVRYSTARMVNLNAIPLAPSNLPFTACDGGSFIIGAVADINPDQNVQLDLWSIDDRRTLMNVNSDCRY